MTLELNDDVKYVVQYRNPFFSIPSYYRLQSRKNKKFNMSKNEFWKEKFDYWQSFMEKWALNSLGNIRLIEYEEIHSFEKIVDIAEFLDLTLDKNEIEENIFSPKRSEIDKEFFIDIDLKYYTEKVKNILSSVS